MDLAGNKRRYTLLLGGALLLLGVAVLRWRQIATWPAAVLMKDDAPFGAVDVIMPLMGDTSGQRADRTLDLWLAGVAPKIAIVQEERGPFNTMGIVPTGETTHRALLEARGVPTDAIVIVPECIATSTRDEARCLRAWIETSAPTVRHVVIVTSWYHTRRAAWLFKRILGPIGVDVAVAAAGSPRSRPDGWWEREDNFIAVYTEYLKWAYWLARLVAGKL